MRSIGASESDTPDDGRTAKVRIRDTAIECFAEHGLAGTTARKVATAAGVSPGLVIHHFGSMDGLRAACDEHVAASIRRQKSATLAAGPGLDILAAMRNADTGYLGRYLAEILVDDSPAVEQLVDDLVADAEDYFQQGVDAGTIVPTENPRGRAAVLVLWTLGGMVLHKHMDRLLGVDLTDPGVTANPSLAAYAGPVYEILSGGFFTEEFTERLRGGFTAMADGLETEESPPSPDGPADDQTTTKGNS